jgi:type 1 glutamine amidotransferase
MRNRLVLLCLALAGLAVPTARADESPKPLKVCILSGCNTYDSETSLPPFQAWLEQSYNVRCVRVVRKADGDLPGLEQLDNCDVAFVFIKRMQLKDDQLARFKSYMTSGRPIVAVRTASHAVQTWLEFDKEVLGGNYHGHHPMGPVTKVAVAAAAKQHPILAGVELTAASESLYKNEGHASDIQLLLSGTIPGQPTEALAWTREYKGGRVFYTSLGGQETFQQTAFRSLLANALFWASRRNVEAKRSGPR